MYDKFSPQLTRSINLLQDLPLEILYEDDDVLVINKVCTTITDLKYNKMLKLQKMEKSTPCMQLPTALEL